MDRSGLGDDMMTKASHDDLARRLRAAYDGGAVPPLRDGLDPTDADGAYAVQTINTRFRSEEHTSELQSLMRISYAVFCLKKKQKIKHQNSNIAHTNSNILQPHITTTNTR